MPRDLIAYAEPIVRSEPRTVDELLATPEHLRRWLAGRGEYVGECFLGDRCVMHSFVFDSIGERLHFSRSGYVPIPHLEDSTPDNLPKWAATFIRALDDEMREGSSMPREIPASTALRILSEVTGA